MKIGVIGSAGMFGKEVVSVLRDRGHLVSEYSLYDFEFQGRYTLGQEDIGKHDWIVNCAGYTDIDDAEINPTEAFEVNAIGTGKIARMCSSLKIKFLNVSTDYVFDGEKTEPYTEEDLANPVNTYGMSKFIGETLGWKELPEILNVRTQSLYGLQGTSFVQWVLDQVKEGKKELRIVSDRVSCPTNVRDLAEAVSILMEKDITGVTVHVSSEGFCSLKELTEEILRLGDIKDVSVIHADVDAETGRVLRPKYTVLSKVLYKEKTGKEMPDWKDGLRRYFEEARKSGIIV